MTCADSITEYAENAYDVIHTFSITQHWKNGSAGFASGSLQLQPGGGQDGSPAYTWVGLANMSYDPYNRNPSYLHVNSHGHAWMSYYGPGWDMGAELTNLWCHKTGANLSMIGIEKTYVGPADAVLPTLDQLILTAVPYWEFKVTKEIVAALEGAAA
jgi:hypothetical protein